MAAITYVITLWLRPPIKELTISATQAKINVQLRLQRSARIPDGTSNNGTTAAYAAAIAPTEAASKPISVMNTFSMGTHKISPCSATANCSGSRRRVSVRGLAATAALMIGDCLARKRGQGAHEAARVPGSAHRAAVLR